MQDTPMVRAGWTAGREEGSAVGRGPGRPAFAHETVRDTHVHSFWPAARLVVTEEDVAVVEDAVDLQHVDCAR